MPSPHQHVRVLSARAAGYARHGCYDEAAVVLHELAVAVAEQRLLDLAAKVRLTQADRRRLTAALGGGR